VDDLVELEDGLAEVLLSFAELELYGLREEADVDDLMDAVLDLAELVVYAFRWEDVDDLVEILVLDVEDLVDVDVDGLVDSEE